MMTDTDKKKSNLKASESRIYEASTSSFRVLDTQCNYSTAASSDLFVAIFHKETQAAALNLMLTYLDTMARNNKGVVNLLNIVRPGSPMPDEAARKALTGVFRYIADQGGTAQSAVVFEGSGTTASIIRSVVTGLSLISKTMLPIKVFSTVEDAVKWLEPHVKSITVHDAWQITSVIQEMDKRYQKKFPGKDR